MRYPSYLTVTVFGKKVPRENKTKLKLQESKLTVLNQFIGISLVWTTTVKVPCNKKEMEQSLNFEKI